MTNAAIQPPSMSIPSPLLPPSSHPTPPAPPAPHRDLPLLMPRKFIKPLVVLHLHPGIQAIQHVAPCGEANDVSVGVSPAGGQRGMKAGRAARPVPP